MSPVSANDPVLEEDFESGWGNWSADNGLWEVGTPTVGPIVCHGGTQCAGTVLDGNHPTDTDSRLISPSLRLPDVSTDEKVLLRFWHWFSFGTASGNVQLSVQDEVTEEWSVKGAVKVDHY